MIKQLIRNKRHKEHTYITRWPIIKTPWFQVWIHKISADKVQFWHDHPYDAWSILLKGSYVEQLEFYIQGKTFHFEQEYKRFSINKMNGNNFHRVIPDCDCYTLFINKPWRKEWHFKVKGKLIDWREWLDTTVYKGGK